MLLPWLHFRRLCGSRANAIEGVFQHAVHQKGYAMAFLLCWPLSRFPGQSRIRESRVSKTSDEKIKSQSSSSTHDIAIELGLGCRFQN